MAVKVLLFLAVLLKVTIGQGICNNCYEGPCLPVCCDCGPDDATTAMPMDMTSTLLRLTSTQAALTTAAPDTTEAPLTTQLNPIDTTDTPIVESTEAAVDTTEVITIETTEIVTVETTESEEPDDGICAYWTSNRADFFGPAGGAPIGVCIKRWGGSQQASESYKYVCSDDGSTVKYYRWQTTTECDDNVATPQELPFTFDPSLYPDQDIFNCEGDPCPYYIIQDGTAHPDQRCPYDEGIKYTEGENDYATWSHQLILQGCQSFNGLTSLYAKCSEDNGIEVFHFANPYCDGSVAYTTEAFNEGTIECNYGTGRAVYCFDEDGEPSTTDIDDEPSTTDMDTDNTSSTEVDPTDPTDPDDTAATDPDDTSATEPDDTVATDPNSTTPTDPDDAASSTADPQLCAFGKCSSGQRFKPGFIGICIVSVIVWFRV